VVLAVCQEVLRSPSTARTPENSVLSKEDTVTGLFNARLPLLGVDVTVGVEVDVLTGVLLAVGVSVGVFVGVDVADVGTGVDVTSLVGVGVAVGGKGVKVAVFVGVKVGRLEGVMVGVGVGSSTNVITNSGGRFPSLESNTTALLCSGKSTKL